jgi:hypothetical protein
VLLDILILFVIPAKTRIQNISQWIPQQVRKDRRSEKHKSKQIIQNFKEKPKSINISTLPSSHKKIAPKG